MRILMLLLLGTAMHAQQATVTVLHEPGTRLVHANRWKIDVDSRQVGEIGKGQYLIVKLEPGRHVFATPYGNTLPIDAQAGDVIFIRAYVSDRGGWHVKNTLEVVPCAQAQAYLEGARAVRPGDLPPSCK